MTDSRAENVEPLQGFKIAAMQKQLLDQFQRAIDDVELRKVALQTACSIYEALVTKGVNPPDPSPLSLARAMHQFLSEPAREVVVTLKPPAVST